jgi:hypothetical protein
VLVPFGAGQDGARRKYLDQAELITTTLLGVSGVGAVAWSSGFAVLRDGIMQSGLVCFDLSDQVNAICGRLLEEGGRPLTASMCHSRGRENLQIGSRPR